MRYGYFDEQAREYVIERPDTPMSWVNYLGVDDYCGIVSNNAAGYAFHHSAKSGRLLRFRFNSVPMDRPGRYVFLRDQEDGDYWSVSWQPVGKPLDQFKSSCAHGLGYSRFESTYKGIRASMRIFVPMGQPLEVWEVEVENTSDKPRKLATFGYAEWCFWDMNQDAFNFQYILYTCRMGYADDCVDYSIRLWPFREPKGFFGSSLKVESFDTDREEFLGRYRHEGNAMSLERGECNNSIALGGTPCGALQSNLELAPGQKVRFVYVMGIGDAKTVGAEAKKRFANPAECEKELAKVRAYYDERLAKLTCKTPSSVMNLMLNTWNQLQCQTTFKWSRSASFNEAGGRDGLGYRDSAQDTLGVMHSIPELVRGRLVDLLHGQYSSGAAMHGVQPLTWKQSKSNLSDHLFSDDHLWLLLCIPGYLKETADFAFLDEVVEYADEGKATVWEHLKRACDFSWSKRGPHGLLLGLMADWNDCLNLRGNGESMFSTFLYIKGLKELLALGDRVGRAGDLGPYREQLETMQKNVNQHAWDGDWFVRGYLDSGKPLGGKASEQSKIFINSQTWAVIAEVAPKDKLERAMDSLKEHLATEHGVMANAPGYTEHDPEVGSVTTFPRGLKENAGIFCHANTWTIVAEGLLGRGDRANELYESFLPAAKNDDADRYSMEPYVYSQFITGREHPKFGRARNSWLTGTASWAFTAATQYILGIRADYDGLVISPAIPTKWDGFEATRSYRGVTYKLSVKNPKHVSSGVKSLVVDGKRVDGNRIPIAKAGSTVNVEITLGE
jgi:N,N'-diacetylchitobiose phosphorylase